MNGDPAELLAADRARFPEGGPGRALEPLAAGASGRVFLRVRGGEPARVLMLYPPEPAENRRFDALAEGLRAAGLPVPALLAAEPEAHRSWVEDVGDRTLESLAHADPSRLAPVYRQAVATLARLHALPARFPPAEAEPTLGPLDRPERAAEHDAFAGRFLGALQPEQPDPLEAARARERERLLDALEETPHGWIHRDFQSRNLVLDDQGVVRVLDFQGLRRGPVLYDLASLLYDPYVPLVPPLRDELLAAYAARAPLAGEARRHLAVAAVQRLLQALGTFGEFGLRRGVPAFRQPLPTALRRLEEAAREAGFPAHAEAAARWRDHPRIREIPG